MNLNQSFYIYQKDTLLGFLQERLNECARLGRWGKEAPTIGRKTNCELCGHPIKVHSYATPKDAQRAIDKYVEMYRAYGKLTHKQRLAFARLHAQIEGVTRFLEYYAHVSEPPGGCELYVGALASIQKERIEVGSDWNHTAACSALDNNGFGGRKNIKAVREAEKALGRVFDFGSRCRELYVAGEAIHRHWPEDPIGREEHLRQTGGVSQTVLSPLHLSNSWGLGGFQLMDDGKILNGKAKEIAVRELRRLAEHHDNQVGQFAFADFVHPRVLSHMLHTGQSRCAVHLDTFGMLLGIQMDEQHIAIGVPTFGRDTAERALVNLYDYYKNGEDLA
jgi:hypothetical protein